RRPTKPRNTTAPIYQGGGNFNGARRYSFVPVPATQTKNQRTAGARNPPPSLGLPTSRRAEAIVRGLIRREVVLPSLPAPEQSASAIARGLCGAARCPPAEPQKFACLG